MDTASFRCSVRIRGGIPRDLEGRGGDSCPSASGSWLLLLTLIFRTSTQSKIYKRLNFNFELLSVLHNKFHGLFILPLCKKYFAHLLPPSLISSCFSSALNPSKEALRKSPPSTGADSMRQHPQQYSGKSSSVLANEYNVTRVSWSDGPRTFSSFKVSGTSRDSPSSIPQESAKILSASQSVCVICQAYVRFRPGLS